MLIGKKSTLILVLTFLCSFLSADTIWEGAAAMSRFGEFPVKGFYGASNAFPVNTVVNVENPASGKRADIIIVNNLPDTNIFLLLSKDAAESIEIKQDEIAGVKVKRAGILQTADFAPPAAEKRKADPDYDPSVLKHDFPEDTVVSVVPAPDLVPVPEAVPYAPDKTAFLDPVQADEEEASDQELTPDAALKSVIAVVPLPEAAEADYEEEFPPVTAYEDIVEDDETVESHEYPPVEITEESELYTKQYVLIPADMKPPESEIYLPEIADKPEIVFEDYTEKDYTEKLEKESFYLQIAAFRDLVMAKTKKNTVNIDYPVIIYYEKKSNYYKIMAGPLKNDEKGLALMKVRYSGYRDAFIQRSE